MKSKPITFVDLFAGAGGLSLGFGRAGFACQLALDNNEAAVATHQRNLVDPVELRAISVDTELPPAQVIIGGPPCQGFSSAGLRRDGDHRNSLVACFAEIVVRERPLAFVFENVEGFLTSESGTRVLDLLTPLIKAGYLIHLRKVNVANYGVPQHRKRVIAIGGLGWEPSFPKPTHKAFGAPGAHNGAHGLPLTPTLAEALVGLPLATANLKTSSDVLPSDHTYRELTGADLERVKALKQGQTMRDLPEKFWHVSYQRRAYRRVMDGTPTERRGGAPAGLRRLRADEPSKAITSGARSEFVHPTEHRLLTLRECARIQTFPDDFEFEGTLSDKALLIGNAVPPAFGERIAETLAIDLRTAVRGRGPGALLSFIPTASSGMSPALERTRRMVLSTFPCKAGVKALPLQWR